MAQILDPGLKNSDLNNLSSALNDFYEDRSLWNRNAEVMDQEDLTITNVIPEDYPTLSHWVERLNKLKEDKIAEGMKLMLQVMTVSIMLSLVSWGIIAS